MIEFQKNNAGMVGLQKNNASLSFSETVLKGDKGEDGGYYKPSINGNQISWQPSKTDMPPVGDSTLTLRAEDVGYHDSFELGFENVGQTLDALVAGVNATRKDVLRLNKSEHTHSNKSVLDKFADSNGKLQYNGSDVGLKPVKGTDYWTAADKAEIVNDTLAALPTWTGGGY